MDFREFVEDRTDGMYEILESSDIYCNYIGVNEGLFSKKKVIDNNNQKTSMGKLKTEIENKVITAEGDNDLDKIEKRVEEIIDIIENKLSDKEKNNTRFLSAGWYLKWFKTNAFNMIQRKRVYFDEERHGIE